MIDTNSTGPSENDLPAVAAADCAGQKGTSLPFCISLLMTLYLGKGEESPID